MKSIEFRKAINQAKLQPSKGILISLEILVISIVSGMLAESWFMFGGVLLVLNALLFVPYVGPVLIGLVSVGVGTVVGIVLHDGFHNMGMSIVVGFLVAAILYGIHISDLHFLRDVQD